MYTLVMSLNIDPQIEHDLAKLAGMKNISVNALLREFTAEQKRYWQERTEDAASLNAMENGEFIDQETMLAKMDTMIKRAQTLAKNER